MQDNPVISNRQAYGEEYQKSTRGSRPSHTHQGFRKPIRKKKACQQPIHAKACMILDTTRSEFMTLDPDQKIMVTVSGALPTIFTSKVKARTALHKTLISEHERGLSLPKGRYEIVEIRHDK